MKKTSVSSGRRHGLRARLAPQKRDAKTVLTFESASQIYHWTTACGPRRAAVRH